MIINVKVNCKLPWSMFANSDFIILIQTFMTLDFVNDTWLVATPTPNVPSQNRRFLNCSHFVVRNPKGCSVRPLHDWNCGGCPLDVRPPRRLGEHRRGVGPSLPRGTGLPGSGLKKSVACVKPSWEKVAWNKSAHTFINTTPPWIIG